MYCNYQNSSVQLFVTEGLHKGYFIFGFINFVKSGPNFKTELCKSYQVKSEGNTMKGVLNLSLSLANNLGQLKCPCDQKINSYFSLDYKTMLTKH